MDLSRPEGDIELVIINAAALEEVFDVVRAVHHARDPMLFEQILVIRGPLPSDENAAAGRRFEDLGQAGKMHQSYGRYKGKQRCLHNDTDQQVVRTGSIALYRPPTPPGQRNTGETMTPYSARSTRVLRRFVPGSSPSCFHRFRAASSMFNSLLPPTLDATPALLGCPLLIC